MEIKEHKSVLRKALLVQRDSLSIGQRQTMDKIICRQLFALIKTTGAKKIHSYLPFGSEIDITPLLHDLLLDGKTIICPKSLPKKNIENLVLKDLNETEEGRFGTRHPASGIPYTGAIDLYIVPGVGFGKDGYRLGYGSGYYDKYFSEHMEGYKVGICYPFQIIEQFPVEIHDVPMDQLLIAE